MQEPFSIGYVIKKARLSKKVSQKKLAGKLGLTQQYISLLERDELTITVKTLMEIASVLNMCPKDLIPCNVCSSCACKK